MRPPDGQRSPLAAGRSTLGSRDAPEGERVVRIISKLALSSANVTFVDKPDEEEKRLEGSFDDTPRLTKMSSGEGDFPLGERRSASGARSIIKSSVEGKRTVDKGVAI